MGMKGFIFITNAGDFKLDKAHFVEALRQRWTDTQIRENTYGDVTFGMTIKDKFYDFQRQFYDFPDSTALYWYGNYEDFAEFSLWFRKYIPDHYQVEIIDKNGSFICMISHFTTEDEILSALVDDRFDFEIVSPANTQDALRTFAEKFKQAWQDYVLRDDGTWNLRSQEGYIEYDTGKISFETNDLPFAAHFAVWCRSVLPSDQKLTIRGSYFDADIYLKPKTQVETQLTSSTTEDELFDFLTKSFLKEKSS